MQDEISSFERVFFKYELIVLKVLLFYFPAIAFQQVMNRRSQISFSTEGNVSPKIPSSLPEIAKQRELSGTYQSESDTKTKKHVSSAKTKELSGSDIFAPPPEIVPRSQGAGRTWESKQSKDTRESVPRKVRRASAQVSNVSIFWIGRPIMSHLYLTIIYIG